MMHQIELAGSVELMNHTPEGDLLVVNAARCSFEKEHESFNERKDSKLINYLAKHEHLLPFRHPCVTLRIEAPIFVMRQLGKHQVGFSWSEVSRRYVTHPPEFYRPKDWRTTADNVKQGSSDEVLRHPQAQYTQAAVEDNYHFALATYTELLKNGVCAEQARMVLPQSMFTTTVTTGSLLGWFHMYKLRIEAHTQRETQVYAEKIGEIMKELYPISWEALCEHCL